MKSILGVSIVFLSCLSCDFLEKNFSIEDTNKKVFNDNKVRKYHDNGNLKSICGFDKEKRKHGVCITYYENGNVKSEITFNHGEKTLGVSYYESGKPALEINYSNRMKNGKRTRYYENGQVSSEFDYLNNMPGKGLIEYNSSGEKLNAYPDIIIKPIDLINKNGTYLLEISFSKRPKRGEFFMGKLYDDKFLITSPELARLSQSNGKATYRVFVPKGTFRMEKLNFIGKYKTLMGNPYIVEKTFNLAVDNPY